MRTGSATAGDRAAARAGAAAGRALGTAVLAWRRVVPRSGHRTPVAPERMRRHLLIGLAVLLVLGAAYRFWLRDSPLVSVDRVTVVGLTTDDAERLRASLTSTARTMTTLHVEEDRLRRVVAAYPAVRDIEVASDFPHALEIRVIEHRPAAMAITEAGRVPVAVDGTVLRGLPVEDRLPTIQAEGGLSGDRLEDPRALAAALVAGGAPDALKGRLREVERRPDQGLVAVLRNGPDVVFGDTRRLRAKWVAATRVLADSQSRGAAYVDVRVPGRPAVGGLAYEAPEPVAPVVASTPGLTAPSVAAPDADATAGPQQPAAESPVAPDPTSVAPPAPQVPPLPRSPALPLQESPATREAPRPPRPKTQPTVEVRTNPRSSVETERARFIAGSVDTSAEVHLQCGPCGGREPSMTA